MWDFFCTFAADLYAMYYMKHKLSIFIFLCGGFSCVSTGYRPRANNGQYL